MSNLKEIQTRHGWDRWKDIAFIGAAVLMTALALGSVSSGAVGSVGKKEFSLSVVYSGQIEVQK